MRTLRLLVVDEDSASRRACAEFFGELGCRTVTAGDSREAMAALDVGRFDLVCLNPHLTDGSSGRVLARLGPDPFVVGLTTDRGDLPARYNGVIARPLTRGVAVITLLLARLAKAGANGPADQPLSQAAFTPA